MSVESARYWLAWLEVESKVAIILVVLGVGYEYVEKRFSAPLQKVIDNARDKELALLQRANLDVAKALRPRSLSVGCFKRGRYRLLAA